MWEAIQQAFEIVASGALKRADGDGFSVYRAGSIIRVDIKAEAGDGK